MVNSAALQNVPQAVTKAKMLCPHFDIESFWLMAKLQYPRLTPWRLLRKTKYVDRQRRKRSPNRKSFSPSIYSQIKRNPVDCRLPYTNDLSMAVGLNLVVSALSC